MSKDTELTHVTRNGMVLEVALNNLLEPFTDLRGRVVLPAAQLCFQGMEFRDHPLLRRFAPDNEGPVTPALSAIVREAQECEGIWLCLPTPFPILFGRLPELDQPRLFRM